MAPTQSRPRNAVATRDAILASAIEHFARAGYDGVGVREIANGAGVTAMLVNRYFGSKEQLFAEAVETSFAPPVYIAEDSASLAEDTAAALAQHTKTETEAIIPFLTMLRSVSNPDAVVIVRDAIERHVGRRLASQMPEPGKQLRTDVLLAVISGVLLMRRVIGTRALNAKKSGPLEDLLEAVFTAIIDTPLPAVKH